jgi:MauM/NapG family ferredoxin protein
MVALTINGELVEAKEGMTVLEAANSAGIGIPHLCSEPDIKPYGACRVCVVEVTRNGRSSVTTSCDLPVEEGMVIDARSPAALKTRKMMVDLLLSRCPNVRPLKHLAAGLGIKQPSFSTENPAEDCILCGLCVRACDEVAQKDVIGFVDRGQQRKVTTAYDQADPYCASCGKCIKYCPTGAIEHVPGITVKGLGRIWIYLRQAVQVGMLALFLYLIYNTVRGKVLPVPANLFSRFDPLMALVAMIGGKELIANMIPALITIVVTLLIGRVWCGWICPLGTVLHAYGPKFPKLPNWLRSIKYILLIAFVGGALLGVLAFMWFDPITIFVRPLAGTVFPYLLQKSAPIAIPDGLAAQRVAEIPLRPLIHRELLIPLGIVLFLNLFAKRFWCRYLCPLGALIALTSKFALIKRYVDKKICFEWGCCLHSCPMDTIAYKDLSSDPGECIMCMDCIGDCPSGSTKFGRKAKPTWVYSYDPSRRKALVGVAAGVAGAFLLRMDAFKSKYQYLIRPPGAEQNNFLSKCIRCGQCIKICPNNALHLVAKEGGIESHLTPVLIPRTGACDWECNSCGQICPTQAIPKLSLEQKRKQQMGTAVVNTEICIRCLLCIKECPVKGALVQGTIEGLKGKYPIVDATKCIGCGACEFICPIKGEAAIRVEAPPKSA